MILKKLEELENLITVPNVDKQPDESIKAMKILNLIVEIRGLVKNNAVLPHVIDTFCDNCGGDFFVTTINGGKKCDKCGKPVKQNGL